MENNPDVIRAIVSAYARSVGDAAESGEVDILREMGAVEGFETSVIKLDQSSASSFRTVRRLLYLAAGNMNVSRSVNKDKRQKPLILNGVELPEVPSEQNARGVINYYFSGLEVIMGRPDYDSNRFVEPAQGQFNASFARKVLSVLLSDVQAGVFPPSVEGTAPPSLGGAGVSAGTPAEPERPIVEPARPPSPRRTTPPISVPEEKPAVSYKVARGWTPKRTTVDTVSEFAKWEQAVREGAEQRVAVYAEALDRALNFIQQRDSRLYDQLVESVQRASARDITSGSKMPEKRTSGKVDTSLELDTLVQAAFEHKNGSGFEEETIAESFSAKFGRRVAPETIGNLVKSVANSKLHPTGMQDVHDAVAAFSTESGLHETTAKNVSGLMKDVADAPTNASRAPYRTRALTIGSSMIVQ